MGETILERRPCVDNVRVAFGTGVVLGLWRGQLTTPLTTAHLLTHNEGRCRANCRFCPQAQGSVADLKMLSRIVWPKFDFGKVLRAFDNNSKGFERVCVQAVNYPGVVGDLIEIVSKVGRASNLPVSVSCQPLDSGDIRRLAEAGADRISIALDAATPELFERFKGGPYSWEGHLKALEKANSVFSGRVSTHIIAGLGESEEEIVRTMQLLHGMGITLALFAFTPIAGTPLSNMHQPDIASYHRIQLARFLIFENLSSAGRMGFEGGRILDFGVDRDVLNRTIESGEPFRTSGCPGCNRPFYNESPRGPIYNYPRRLKPKEVEAIRSGLGLEL